MFFYASIISRREFPNLKSVISTGQNNLETILET